MHRAFRNRLAGLLGRAPAEGWMTRRGALVAGIGFAAGAPRGAFMGRTPGAPASKPGGEAIVPRPGRRGARAPVSDLNARQGHQDLAERRMPLRRPPRP